MNITKQDVDALNAVVKVDIVAEDYQDKVTEILKDYRKNANIPGFRKGHVPMGMIKKQYGKAVMVDEVNKLLQESLNKFLVEEKLDILGNPLPKVNENFSWDADTLEFEFELGLAPDFKVDLKGKNKIVEYKVEATKDLLEKEVENIQNRYGKMSALDKATEHSNVTGIFVNEEAGIEKKSTFLVNDLKGKKNEKKVIGKKVGDVIELETKKLFEDDHKLQYVLGVSQDEAKELDIKVNFTIEEITKIEPADLDQELFDKVFPDGSVKTASELKDKIKEDAEQQFQRQADQQLLNSITNHFVESTKFDLPQEFLTRWLQNAGEQPLTEDEAKVEFEKSEKDLRHKLIENKIIQENDIKVEQAELQEYAVGFVRSQMAQFGNMNPSEEELNNITARILTDQKQVEGMHVQLIMHKLLDFYKENMKFKTKKVSYEDFIKEVYK